ncbi:MAG: hypothetical protein KJZ85_15225 [Rhodobacteraceae bacterium]|jgi:hypothetical protein|nr:hypothetical protein [Paracoccaceae bacterium]
MTAILPNSFVRPSLGEAMALATALAALGLGLSELSSRLLSPEAADAPPRLVATVPPGAAAGAAAERGPWPAMFGSPDALPPAEVVEDAVEPPPEEPTVPEEEDVWEDIDDDPGPLLDYALKGMIATGENGWILVEIDGEELVFRVGDELPGGELILALTPEGALIEDPYGGPDVLLSPADAEPAAGDWNEPAAGDRDGPAAGDRDGPAAGDRDGPAARIDAADEYYDDEDGEND